MNYELVKQRTMHIAPSNYAEAGQLVLKFLETAQTASNRATANNTRDDVNEAANIVHGAMFDLDRGIYAMLLSLPGTLDTARQGGVLRLLDNARPSTGSGNGACLLELPEETDAIQRLVDSLPRHRQLNLFLMLREGGVNNARTQKLILRTILSWDNLPWAAVKYKQKIRAALQHAWGQRLSGIITHILTREHWDNKSLDIMLNNVAKYSSSGLSTTTGEFLSFVLGNKVHRNRPLSTDLLRAYQDAPADYNALALLPPEIAQDFRARYHKSRSVADVMEKTEKNLTVKARLRIQKQAKDLGVKVELKAEKQDLVDLFVLRYEVGDQDGLVGKITNLVKPLVGFPYERVGVVLDLSQSMSGSKEQKWRPAAWAQAMNATLHKSVKSFIGQTVGETDGDKPAGETDLADRLVSVLMQDEGSAEHVEVVFVLTDGYENAPAGRFAEVVGELRRMGFSTPIFQVTPTFAAEAYGVRQLSPLVPVLTVGTKVEQLATKLNERMIEADFIRGLTILCSQAQIQIGGAA